MNIRNVFIFVLIYLFVQPLCSMQQIGFGGLTQVESIHFVNGGVVLSVLERTIHTVSKKREYLLIEEDKEKKQISTVLYKEKNAVENHENGNYAVNRQGTKIAFLDDGCLSTYDIQKKKEIWRKEVQCKNRLVPMAFNPIDDEEIIFYDSEQNLLSIHSQQKNDSMQLPTTSLLKCFCVFNPTKTEFVFNFNSTSYYLGNYQNKNCKNHDFISSVPGSYAMVPRYSADGSRLITICSDEEGSKIVLIAANSDNDFNSNKCILPTQRSRTCTEVLLHRNNRVAFLLNDMSPTRQFGPCYLYSYDMQTGKLINYYKLDDDRAPYDVHLTNQRIAVSADGRKIGIALDKKCVFLSTLYMLLGTERVKELFQKVHLLQWYAQEQNQENGLPSDIMNAIIDRFLDLHCT